MGAILWRILTGIMRTQLEDPSGYWRRNSLTAVVAGSGSGKSTSIMQVHEAFLSKGLPSPIVRSTTTRNKRTSDPCDKLMYTHVSFDEFQSMHVRDEFATTETYAGNHYAFTWVALQQALSYGPAITSATSKTIADLRKYGLNVTKVYLERALAIPNAETAKECATRETEDLRRKEAEAYESANETPDSYHHLLSKEYPDIKYDPDVVAELMRIMYITVPSNLLPDVEFA